MHEFRQIKPLETMERITRQQFCDNLDEILDRVNQEDIGFVILNAEGKDGHVLCPARWFQIDLGDDFGCMHDSFDAALGGVVNGALCDMPFPTLPLICRGSSGEMPILEACFLVI